MANTSLTAFHGYQDMHLSPEGPPLSSTTTTTRTVSYRFSPHFHPYVAELVKRLIAASVRGFEAADTEYQNANGTVITLPDGKPRPVLYDELFSSPSYQPTELVEQPYPVKDLDFTTSGAYAVYNWELFYHVPLTIAMHLSKNQRFEDAQKWFHYLFDPTDDSEGPTPERFWKVRPFQSTDVKMIEEILVNLATGTDKNLQNDTISSIHAWKDAPFRPHVVARYRQTAYMFKTVMAYLDNLIAWGDALFKEDTGESINEATQLYVLAANILGPRPQAVPTKDSVRPRTYAQYRADFDAFGNVVSNLETDIAFNLARHPTKASIAPQLPLVSSIGNALFFCIPRNDKLLSYWDTVADRLFKIHNSLNLLGIFRQLPLLEPPIDPTLLARATAAGLDVGAVVSGVNQPLPLVRFQLLVQKAAEICQEVKALGNNLLAAMEKEDNEALAILRARHESIILGLTETVRYSQLQEAIKTRQGLEKTFVSVAQRYSYYERLLGKKESDIQIPEIEALDTDGLAKMQFNASEPEVGLREIAVDIAEDLSSSSGKKISSHEAEELDLLSEAQTFQDAAAIAEGIAAGLSLIPDFGAKIQPFGAGVDITFGGKQLASWLSIGANAARAIAARNSYEANQAARIGSYARREQEWAFQSNLAAAEMTSMLKQLRAAQIREAIAAQEWKNHQQHIKHANEIEHFLTAEKNGKTTNQAFYTWMKREVKGLYAQCFQFAFDVAKKAERALRHELGSQALSFVQYGYLAGKEGLLAGEKLYLDLKRMEMAYHDLNQREYELTKHVSLLQVNPLALLQLRATGRCTVFLPEALFDMDGPGHYFRRIKSTAVSIPCVTGPYSGVNCTLTLLKSSIRKNALLHDGTYAREGAEDDRFSDHFGSVQAIVTSGGQSDSGLFETNLHDERYLPFEGSGVISEWQLALPANPSQDDPCQFDYETITDVILHLRYTAREGGGLLRNGAIANLKTLIDNAQVAGSVRLFSLRHEFPSEWAQFKSVQLGGATPVAALTLTLRAEHYPFWSKGRLDAVTRAAFFAKTSKTSITVSDKADGTGHTDTLVKDAAFGDLRVGELTDIPLPAPVGQLTLYFNDNAMENMWLALTWS